MDLPNAVFADILLRTFDACPLTFLRLLVFWCYDQTPDLIIALVNELRIEEILCHLPDWGWEMRCLKKRFVALAVGLGCRDVICHIACSEIFRRRNVEGNLIVLLRFSSEHTLSRFSFYILTVFYNPRRADEAIRELGRLAGEISTTVDRLRDFIIYMRTVKRRNALLPADAQPLMTSFVVPHICHRGDKAQPGHFNPHTWPPRVSDVKTYDCVHCRGVCTLYLFCKVENAYL